MKLIKCIVPTIRLEALKQALLEEGVQGMTVYDARGFSIHHSQLSEKASRNYVVEFQPRTVIEVVVANSRVEALIKLMTSVARTGRLGDGKLFVLPVEEAVRLRTGERGDAAV